MLNLTGDLHIAVELAFLFEGFLESGIVDGDGCLGGKGLGEVEVGVGKATVAGAVGEDHHADHVVTKAHGNQQ